MQRIKILLFDQLVKVFKKEITFEDLFKSQILKYFELIELNNTKYPIFAYRLILNTLIKVDRINFLSIYFLFI